jgi:hypothetical protein
MKDEHEGDVTMTQTALRWSGAALVAFGLLLVPGAVLATLQARGQISFAGFGFLNVMGPALFMLALQGVYARQAEAAGLLGLVGHVLLSLGTVLLIVLASQSLYQSQPRLRTEGGVTLLALAGALVLGFILTGLATLRAAVYSRWVGVLLLVVGGVVAPFFFAAPFIPDPYWLLGSAVAVAALTVSVVWLGVALWRGAERSALYRPRVAAP